MTKKGVRPGFSLMDWNRKRIDCKMTGTVSLDELRRMAAVAAETTRASEASTGSLPLRRSSTTGSLPSVDEQSEAVDGGGPVQRV